jgi:formyltetrahydrofolate deformylase
MKTAVLLISCIDKIGIVFKISGFLTEQNCNIIQSDQYTTNHEGGHFFIRVEFAYDDSQLSKEVLIERFKKLGNELDAKWELHFNDAKKRVGILVSRYEHCLLDILHRYKIGEFNIKIPFIVSNHEDLGEIAKFYGIDFHYLPINKESRLEQEKRLLNLAKDKTDFLVLARYMQVLSSNFLAEYGKKVINIHHSFLPSFKGSNPYKQAWERGVKIIGATAHYATANLDEGPIIAQQVAKASHKDNIADLTRIGRDIEKLVLAEALRAQIENRIIQFGNKTIVFR